jgi:SAM-dependent methyltransferase
MEGTGRATPGRPRGGFYGGDLAHVHDSGFDRFALGAARTLRRVLQRAGIRDGLVVDLGCGSGVTAAELTAAGYEVLGVDLSAELLALARRRVPSARFVHASLFDVELPACVAVTAVGESMNYLADPRAGRAALTGVFARAHRALRPGGALLFDLAEPGRERGLPPRRWSEGPGWLVCVEAVEEPDERLLRRRIATFRRAGLGWRRSDELHVQRLFPRQEVLEDLAAAGFAGRLLAGYGGGLRFRRGHAGYLAVKPG